MSVERMWRAVDVHLVDFRPVRSGIWVSLEHLRSSRVVCEVDLGRSLDGGWSCLECELSRSW